MITVRVQAEDFDVAAELERLSTGAGAVASFIGLVRGDGGLIALTLEHYPAMTDAMLAALGDEAAARWKLGGAMLIHRFGRLEPGARIVLVATAAAHRRDALDACAFLMDALKTRAPFWKSEAFADGRTAWVEPRDADLAEAARWTK